MKSFRQWYEGVVQKRRLAVFDFDDTLVMTPTPEQGIPNYERATGKKWRGGWWGRPETLEPPIFNYEPDKLNQKVVVEFLKSKARADTITVMMTGRHGGVAAQVKKILNHYKLEPDEEYYKAHPSLVGHPDYPKGDDTWDYKHHVLTKRLITRPGIEEVELWDDRVDHVSKWLELARWIRTNHPTIKRVVFHDVLTGEVYEY